MPANQYSFLTEWRIGAPRELVYEILKEGKDYPRWWPEVYLGAEYSPSNREDHLGDRVSFFTRGWLPYRLRWTAEVVRLQRPQMIEIKATGDFDGQGVWRIETEGEATRVTFDWRLRAEKPLLRWLSPLFKPLFKWNHAWAMARGYESLCREVSRRRDA
ncbi:MAG: SRPBCC family protein [Blastocatellia bacterium]